MISSKTNLFKRLSFIFKSKITPSIFPQKSYNPIYPTYGFCSVNHKELAISPVRKLNIGYNYFRHVNPKRKKLLETLLNSYIKVLNSEEMVDFKNALDIFYNNEYLGVNIQNVLNRELDFPDSLVWHLFSIMIMDRLASQYSRFEYMEYDQLMKQFNNIPKNKRNKAKYVFTSHPTQPNSIQQLANLKEMLKGIEENDLEYLDLNMKKFVESNKEREFVKASYLEESVAYHSMCIPNLINAFSMAYELGLKEPSDFFEIPGTWLTFDFDRHPEMSLGLMAYTHGFKINLTLDQYTKMIVEADIGEDLAELLSLFELARNYGKKLMVISDKYRNKQITKNEFYNEIPLTNIYGIESSIIKLLNNYTNFSDLKVRATAQKLLAIFELFKLTGCLGQIRFPGEDLLKEPPDQIILEILKEISLLNTNGQTADMIIIANYEYQKQFDFIKDYIKKYQIPNIEVVPLLETFASTNDTDSDITMIASSDTRQRDGLLLTELRTLREYHKNPNKYIYMGQGITAERGGGPYKLIHQKYVSLTRCQRKRHIRTVQGHYFTSEFLSRDLILTFLLNGAININKGDDFEPTQDYMDFLFDLDNIVGVPQREMQKTAAFNNFFVSNRMVKSLVDSYNYAGSREMGKPLENVKDSRAIVQAYIHSDRCSFTHPELCFWDQLDERMIRKMAQHYYDNNRHFKYILFNYGFMISRFDLEFAQEELGLDKNNEFYKNALKGKAALEKILNNLGLSSTSPPMTEMYNQHLGLVSNSSLEERNQKVQAYRNIFKIQNYFARKMMKEKTLEIDYKNSEYKMRILQSALSNVSPFNGKG